MWPWIFRLVAFVLALLGVNLIAVLWRMAALVGRRADAVLQALGASLIELAWAAGAGLLAAAVVIVLAADRRSGRRRLGRG